MKEQLENDLIVALMPYIGDSSVQDVKMSIAMVVSNYDVGKNETTLTVYEGDINEVIMKRWLSAKIAKGLSPKTIKYYRQTVKNILEKIGKPYMDVTPDDVRVYLATRVHRDKATKTTANNERRALSSFYGWLQVEEIMVKNPMSKVDNLKETKQKKHAFTPMEIEKIRYACRSARETAFIEVLLSTWCRITEVVNIKITDIENDRITVHGKGDKYRDVYLNARALFAVKNYLDERKDTNPYLFPAAKEAGDITKFCGEGKGAIKRSMLWYQNPELIDPAKCMDVCSAGSIIRNIGKRAGVEKTHPHRFRRTGATWALRNGMPIVQVSKLLGHASIATTQIYLDVTDDELEQAHKKYVT